MIRADDGSMLAGGVTVLSRTLKAALSPDALGVATTNEMFPPRFTVIPPAIDLSTSFPQGGVAVPSYSRLRPVPLVAKQLACAAVTLCVL